MADIPAPRTLDQAYLAAILTAVEELHAAQQAYCAGVVAKLEELPWLRDPSALINACEPPAPKPEPPKPRGRPRKER